MVWNTYHEVKMKQLADEVVGFVRTFLFLHRFLFLYFSSSVPLFYANTRYWYFFLNSSSITNQKTVVPGCSVIKKARSIPHVNNKSDCFGFVKVGLLITFSTCRLSRRFADFALRRVISPSRFCVSTWWNLLYIFCWLTDVLRVF